jgi:dihydropteroate synthase
MGILNVTPDSFYDGGRYLDEEKMIKHVENMLEEGAIVIDIGGYSSRPGADYINEEEEIERVIPAIKFIHHHFPKAILSVDSFRSNVASRAIENGAVIVNDISGGSLDDKMFDVMAYHNVPYVLMHMKGNPGNMKEHANYEDMMREIMFYFSQRINLLRKKGIKDIIIDPGFGFAKNLEQNYELLNRLEEFKIFELPIMVGVSRKSMITRVLNIKPVDALNGSIVLHAIGLMKRVDILRVHDVKEAVEVLKIVNLLS